MHPSESRSQHFHFKILKETGSGRLGELATPHGIIQTPAFIFCATKAAIKGLLPQQIQDANTQIILANTYHLMLQPGADTVKRLGGLQKMTGWNGPMLTDSGGFQIFSLGHGGVANEIKGTQNSARPKTLLNIFEDGATFKSYIDGSVHHLTPEKSIEVQVKLGADLIVVLDECTPFHVDKSYTQRSMEMSHRWALRSLAAFDALHASERQRLYGIIQGGIYPDLRKISAEFVNEQDFFGHAVGGCLGASKEQMDDVVSLTLSLLAKDRPVHLLGIGGIRDIFHGVPQGIDTFDCVHPTRLARHGGALVPTFVRAALGTAKDKEHINLKNSQFQHDDSPIDPSCGCQTCSSLSRGYIHHLIKAKELSALQALTVHNMYTMNRVLEDIRAGINQNNFEKARDYWVST
ncbi:MAG: tRNA guanosine(34) transglycosylase Tgt [Alphaproteobacteria bacterium]|nr:tRNA guanosine(34) transglycosylase Tgt [Alphaproteobacteria bacterium]OJV45136.1 MAG: tRNA guanosine(34) transglycosylase Tgt [Alphaproteobacteria bacterium 43-37]